MVETEYIVIVNCRNILEKKRVDYVLEKRNVDKVKGFVLKLEKLDDELVEEIYSKLVEGDVEIYKVQPITVRPSVTVTEHERIYMFRGKDKETVHSMIVLIMGKMNAVMDKPWSAENVIEGHYSVYVKGKGKVDVKTVVREEGEGTRVILTLRGMEDAVNALQTQIDRDITLLGGEIVA